jgi:hypothetical protein
MPTIDVDLWDDSGNTILTIISVMCNEQQARQMDAWMKIRHFPARRLPQGVGRHMTFEQFKKWFVR